MFGIQVSGLNVHQKFLDVTSNNISNANTIGFKYSRAEFGDIYTNSVFTNTKTSVGLGAVTATVAQQFAQGSLSGDTGNNLDMAINGNGFFVLAPSADRTVNNDLSYTRAGAFEINNKGYVVTPQGDYLQAYDVNADRKVSNVDLNATHAIQIPQNTGAPKQTSVLGIGINLPATAEALSHPSKDAEGNPVYPPASGLHAADFFDPLDPTTYTASTSQIFHDSLGSTHTLTYYFMKDYTDPDTDHTKWQVITMVDGTTRDNLVDVFSDGSEQYKADEYSISGDSTLYTKPSKPEGGNPIKGRLLTLEFDTNGNLIRNANDQVIGFQPMIIMLRNKDGDTSMTEGGADHNTLYKAMGGGVDDTQVIQLKPEFTQYGSSDFTITKTATNDGYATGQLTNVHVNSDGLMIASYSNGREIDLGCVALANFINPQGLMKIGDTQWKASLDSGEAMACLANVGTTGTIKGANLEDSNVDLTAQLVDLIIAQRGYQANAQALQTQNNVMDAIMRIS